MLNRSYQIGKYWRCKKGLSGKLPGSFGFLRQGERPWALECGQRGPRATGQETEWAERTSSQRWKKAARVSSGTRIALRAEPGAAAKDTSKLNSSGLRWQIVSVSIYQRQEQNITPRHPGYTRWLKYVTLNTSGSTLKRARNSKKKTFWGEIKLPKYVGLEGS